MCTLKAYVSSTDREVDMALVAVTAAEMRTAFLSAANNISNHKEYINQLNVFPVPDGDTGTNMTLTIMTAASEVRSLAQPTMENLARAITSGSLRGARGNSGVILSQLLRGFSREIKEKKELDMETLAMAFGRAVDTAYKAVMKPKEGTILTVARAIAEKAAEYMEGIQTSGEEGEPDIIRFLREVVAYGDEVLQKTPDMLPVLAEAGVVDSGGQGLMEIFHGILLALEGNPVEAEEPIGKIAGTGVKEIRPFGSGSDDISTADIKFTYCTEFIVTGDHPFSDEEVNAFREFLLSIGDSLVCVNDEEMIKIHVHSNHPGEAFEKALTMGSLTNMKIDNMKEEHSERVAMEQERIRTGEFGDAFRIMKEIREKSRTDEGKDAPMEEFGVIAVAQGSGMETILKGIGVDFVLSGGQTMNPSTEDILAAAREVPAKNIFVFPNNSNIIMAAQQAASISKEKKLWIIPSKSVPQCISGMMGYSKLKTAKDNEKEILRSMGTVTAGEVTYAVRDTEMNGKVIKKDDIIGIGNGAVQAVGQDRNIVTEELLSAIGMDEAEICGIYYGEDVPEDEANQLVEKLSARWPEVEFDLEFGGQPIYSYIVSVE